MAALLLLHATGTGEARDGTRTEELELDRDDLRHGLAEVFLDAVGLGAQDILGAMRVVHMTARGGRPVLLRVEINAGTVTVEALERLGEEVTPPPFIQAAPDSRVEFRPAGAAV
jgi:hypothetical protein